MTRNPTRSLCNQVHPPSQFLPCLTLSTPPHPTPRLFFDVVRVDVRSGLRNIVFLTPSITSNVELDVDVKSLTSASTFLTPTEKTAHVKTPFAAARSLNQVDPCCTSEEQNHFLHKTTSILFLNSQYVDDENLRSEHLDQRPEIPRRQFRPNLPSTPHQRRGACRAILGAFHTG